MDNLTVLHGKLRSKATDLEVETYSENTWVLSHQNPKLFTTVVFYRGWYCPICKSYLTKKGVDKNEG